MNPGLVKGHWVCFDCRKMFRKPRLDKASGKKAKRYRLLSLPRVEATNA